jgi:hypothetical protein
VAPTADGNLRWKVTRMLGARGGRAATRSYGAQAQVRLAALTKTGNERLQDAIYQGWVSMAAAMASSASSVGRTCTLTDPVAAFGGKVCRRWRGRLE